MEKIDQKKAGLAVLGTYFGYRLLRYAWWRYKNAQVKAKGAKPRQNRDSKNFVFRDIPGEENIIKMDVSRLRKGLIDREFSSVDLVHVYGKRCQTIGRLLCLSAEENFENAMAEAEVKD